jgi:hypothetical protein
LSFHKLKVSINYVYQEISQRDEVISSTQALASEGIFTTKNEITLKTVHLSSIVMISIFIAPFSAETEINDFKLV